MASLGKLAAGVAHQLNNPLNGITLFTKLVLEDYELEDEVRGDLSRVLRNAERCRDIVKELLEFARQTSQDSQPQDINRAVSRTLFLLAPQSSRRHPADQPRVHEHHAQRGRSHGPRGHLDSQHLAAGRRLPGGSTV